VTRETRDPERDPATQRFGEAISTQRCLVPGGARGRVYYAVEVRKYANLWAYDVGSIALFRRLRASSVPSLLSRPMGMDGFEASEPAVPVSTGAL
jgi:hypothetical protein